MPPPLTLSKIQLLRFLSIYTLKIARKTLYVAMLRHHVVSNISKLSSNSNWYPLIHIHFSKLSTSIYALWILHKMPSIYQWSITTFESYQYWQPLFKYLLHCKHRQTLFERIKWEVDHCCSSVVYIIWHFHPWDIELKRNLAFKNGLEFQGSFFVLFIIHVRHECCGTNRFEKFREKR